ncbi:MAG: DUF1553 domain-containing protein [Planctomycetia bacterium]|nr:DUF1553 domain-containing protein [Planctomycetia bacterium]
MRRSCVPTLFAVALASLGCFVPALEAAEPSVASLPAKIDFNRDIAPILSSNCFYCHGPDPKHREGDLRLDLRAAATADHDGHRAIVAGKPAESELIRRVKSTDADVVMPPPDSNKKLTPREVKLLEQWIAEGAEYRSHWAYTPLTKPRAPTPAKSAVSESDWGSAAESLSSPIDAFLRDRWEREKLKPVDEADPITLCRRLYFDLTGLPPTPEEVAKFVAACEAQGKDAAATRERAYRELVDKLLASQRYGERMAAWWLDLVRYADTVGYHGDQNVTIWPFRDYVIEAFNKNMPFDRFTREQLAGDLLPEPTRAQRVASGYNRLGMMTAEGGAQDKEYLAKYAADRVRNVSSVWLGATLGCAECHDHKFDPLTARDFYGMAAFFADLKEQGFYGGSHASGKWGPNILLTTPEQEARLKQLAGEITQLQKEVDAKQPEAKKKQAEWEKKLTAELTIKKKSDEPKIDDAGKDKAGKDKLGKEKSAGNEKLSQEKPGKDKEKPVIEVAKPVAQPQVAKLPADIVKALGEEAGKRTPQTQERLFAYYLEQTDPKLGEQLKLLKQRQTERTTFEATIPSTLVTEAVAPRTMRILARGNWMDESGPTVEPSVPSFLPQPQLGKARRATRADLAAWITAGDNPLPARVFVNRLWAMYFGIGLSKRLDDFGAQGEPPVHPELLDWLATEFRDGSNSPSQAGGQKKWDVKHLVRLIVGSKAYRRSSVADRTLIERDPYNRLYARQGRFRMPAESVRDGALAVSGLLSTTIGGRSVRPYQPAGYYAQLNFPKREYEEDTGENLWRRSVYTHWQRTFLHPAMTAFDAPSREECTCERVRSNTPLQALVMLNDPEFVEAARALAERVLREASSTSDERAASLYRIALQRAPQADERKLIVELVDKHRAEYKADVAAAKVLVDVGARPVAVGLDPAELAAWTGAARIVLNLHEFINRD